MKRRFREQLDAGPGAVDLRERSPFYYRVGVTLAALTDDQFLHATLLALFSGERFKRVLDCALNSLNEDVHAFTRELPDLEKGLFETGYRASEEYLSWKSRLFNKLAASKVIEGKVAEARAGGARGNKDRPSGNGHFDDNTKRQRVIR